MLSNLKTSITSPILILIIIFTILSLGILYPILSLVLLGAMIAYLVRPLAQKIKPFVRYETLAILLAMIILVIPVFLVLYFTVSQLLQVAVDILGSIPSSPSNLTSVNNTFGSADVQNLGPLDNTINNILDDIGKLVSQAIAWLAGQVVATLAYIPTLFTEIIILLFSIFYFAKDGDRFVNFIKDLLPKTETFNNLYQQVDDIFKSIMIVNVITAIILGLFSAVLYYILGYPYILLLGIITAISEFIPVVGPWIVYGVLGLLDILTGNYLRGLAVIIAGWLIDTVVDMYIRPRLAGRYSKVHPLVFLLGFIFGAITLGLPGLFVGPLIVGTAYVLYHAYREEKVAEKKV